MLDLSALDAELDGLGRAPENVPALAQKLASIALSGDPSARLEQVDSELSALAVLLARGPARLDDRNVDLRSGVSPVQPALRALETFETAQDAHETASVPSTAPPEPEREPELEPISEPLGQSDGLAHTAEPELHAATLTQSQEIVLPDPIARDELSSESGELSLAGDAPSSGSFELPATPSETRSLAEDSAEHSPLATHSGELNPFDDIQDALEGSEPIAMSATRATLGPSSTSSSGLDLDRDPDAEFDALLSEATDPRGIPTAGASSEVDTDDLLRGLEGDELEDEGGGFSDSDENAPHEADLLTRSLYEDADDNTDILDRNALAAIESEAGRTDRPPEDLEDALGFSPDELDSGELELLVEDEPTLAPQASPMRAAPLPPPPKVAPARPGLSNKAPPPPPPSSSPDRRPSGGLLGRLFTKRDGE